MLTASYQKHLLKFKIPGGTSRGILKTKETFFIILEDKSQKGIGECALFRGLSIDDCSAYEKKLKWVCDHIDLGVEALYDELIEFPSIQIGLETAFKSLASQDLFRIFPSEFSNGNDNITINGLVWMGSESFMKQQISVKLAQGFRCIKMKIGAIDFDVEMNLLKSIRKEYSSSDIELRVDANGAFSPSEALEKLKWLSEFELHSIEQPIKQGQWQEMARLCEDSPLAIALDEELIGVFSEKEKLELLNTIHPQYIILKPSLIGGFKGSDDWISFSESKNIGWWITSALESNIGLNAIAQYTHTKSSKLPQGLGTGSLFTNNISSPLEVCNGNLYYNTNKKWDLDMIKF